MRAVVIHAERDLRVEESDVAALDPGMVEVRVRCGGICGSDLHYYLHGGFGTVRMPPADRRGSGRAVARGRCVALRPARPKSS
jgi:threonine dehydrogenase-like Zn-dependent dehydrogenase